MMMHPPADTTTGRIRVAVHNHLGVFGMSTTEFWERFSFYGLQAILPFYLLFSTDRGGLEFTPAAAAGVAGAYGGAVYLAQLLGAWLGDRVISPKRLVFWGGVVITSGHIVLALTPGVAGLATGLLLLIFGTGALKTNITTIVGFLVEHEPDANRDAGFSWFYLAISIGSVLGPLLTGFAQNEWGFHVGFGVAAIGMALALVQYVFSSRHLPERASVVNNPLRSRGWAKSVVVAVSVAVAVITSTATGLLNVDNIATVVTVLTLAAAAVYFAVIIRSRGVSADERARTIAFLPLFLAVGIYFGFNFQAYTAAAILIDESVDLDLAGWEVPPSWIVTFSSLAVVIALPLTAVLWRRMGERLPKATAKFAIGLMVMASSFLMLFVFATATGSTRIPLLMMLASMFALGASEAFVGPIGLSLATRIAPRRFTSQFVGLNFLTLALGSSLSGVFGQLLTVIDQNAYMLLMGGAGVALAVALFAARRSLDQGLARGL